MTALYAIPIIALAAYLGYKWGKRKAYQDAWVVIGLLDSGQAKLAEDGTVRMADAPMVEDQREVATWQ